MDAVVQPIVLSIELSPRDSIQRTSIGIPALVRLQIR